ncbi:MAG: acyl-CoA dehydrogenase family protein [Acholeplasmataceae bacterium]|nr:acyl-CoA dehydrogenase family protein [Acholeplasmataceae bacterium]
MSVKLKEVNQMLHQMVVDFAEKEIKPLDMIIDKEQGYPKDLWDKIVQTGFLGLTVPYLYDGAQFDAVAEAQTIFDVASRNASVAFTLEGHYKAANQIIKYGNETLKKKYLPQANRRVFAFSSTEPQGGSNVLGLSGTAIKDGDCWVLNGNKSMITNGGLAEVYCVLLKTGPEEISCFVVDKEMIGFKYGKQEELFGMRGTPVGEIFLENVKVSEDHLLGTLGQGIEIGHNAHADARINMGAIAAGISEHALSIVLEYAKTRKALDTPIINLYSIQQKITEIAIAKENTQLLYEEAAKLKDSGKPYDRVATMAKSYGSRASFDACDHALQVLGGYGYSTEYPVEHLLRDARALQIAEGSLEKMVIEIAQAVVKERE